MTIKLKENTNFVKSQRLSTYFSKCLTCKKKPKVFYTDDCDGEPCGSVQVIHECEGKTFGTPNLDEAVEVWNERNIIIKEENK